MRRRTLLQGFVAGAVATVLRPLMGLPRYTTGGPLRAGLPYIVGERGPEWFIPATGGYIYPRGFRG